MYHVIIKATQISLMKIRNKAIEWNPRFATAFYRNFWERFGRVPMTNDLPNFRFNLLEIIEALTERLIHFAA